MIAIYDKATGEVRWTVHCPPAEIESNVPEGCGWIEVEEDPGEADVVAGVVVRRPRRPSASHEWSSAQRRWVANTGALARALKVAIGEELQRRTLQPCKGFDANEIARERITGTLGRLLRGDGLPKEWIGWRDAQNAMHWREEAAEAVRANLAALSRAIEDREQRLLVAAWRHKDKISALLTAGDVDGLLGYDVTAGWPDEVV